MTGFVVSLGDMTNTQFHIMILDNVNEWCSLSQNKEMRLLDLSWNHEADSLTTVLVSLMWHQIYFCTWQNICWSGSDAPDWFHRPSHTQSPQEVYFRFWKWCRLHKHQQWHKTGWFYTHKPEWRIAVTSSIQVKVEHPNIICHHCGSCERLRLWTHAGTASVLPLHANSLSK